MNRTSLDPGTCSPTSTPSVAADFNACTYSVVPTEYASVSQSDRRAAERRHDSGPFAITLGDYSGALLELRTALTIDVEAIDWLFVGLPPRSDPAGASDAQAGRVSKRTAYGTVMVGCAAVTIVAFAEGARSLSARGDNGNARVLIACAVMAAILGVLSWMLYNADRD